MFVAKRMTQYTNHVAFVVDASGSVMSLRRDIIRVFDAQVERLKRRSMELEQETRVSVYLFSDTVDCIVFDMDVMRMKSLSEFYPVTGSWTALLDGTMLAVTDMQKLPELYSDHAFIVYVITDGEENRSRNWTRHTTERALTTLPENWTVACFVPDTNGISEAKRFGFPAGNIDKWSTDGAGLSEVGEKISRTTDNFMTMRAKGVRGSKNLFQTDLSGVATKAVLNLLEPLKGKFTVYAVGYDAVIRPFVETHTGRDYVVGNSYYRLDKPEKIQPQKEIIIRQKVSGKAYGGPNARTLLSLPDYEIRVAPGDHGDWDIFVQSTSVNRKLLAGTKVLVLR